MWCIPHILNMRYGEYVYSLYVFSITVRHEDRLSHCSVWGHLLPSLTPQYWYLSNVWVIIVHPIIKSHPYNFAILNDSSTQYTVTFTGNVIKLYYPKYLFWHFVSLNIQSTLSWYLKLLPGLSMSEVLLRGSIGTYAIVIWPEKHASLFIIL